MTLLWALAHWTRLSHFSRVRLCDPLGCSLPAPLAMGFSRQECWSGVLFPPPGDLPDQGANLSRLCSCIECGFFTTGPWLDQDGASNPTWATAVLSGGFGPEKRRVREKTRQRYRKCKQIQVEILELKNKASCIKNFSRWA